MSRLTQYRKRMTNSEREMYIDIDQLSVTGHVVFAGRDGTVKVNTGGDVDQTTTHTVTIGGIQASPEAAENLITTIEQVEETIETDTVDEETKEVAQHHFATIKKLLLSKKRPNPKILIHAVKILFRISPLMASGIIAIFGEPLAAQIVGTLGGGAVQFFERLMARSEQKLS